VLEHAFLANIQLILKDLNSSLRPQGTSRHFIACMNVGGGDTGDLCSRRSRFLYERYPVRIWSMIPSIVIGVACFSVACPSEFRLAAITRASNLIRYLLKL
jgi:hypothetical protein